MRLSKHEMRVREDYIRELLKEDESLTDVSINNKLKEKYKTGMAPPRISKIKKAYKAGQPPLYTSGDGESEEGEEETSVEDTSAHHGKARTHHGQQSASSSSHDGTLSSISPLARSVTTVSEQEESDALQRAVEVMRSIGAENIKITYYIPRAVAFADPKMDDDVAATQ